MKKTKRKYFKFYRSYYDVFNELPEKDKLQFIKSLLDKQFLDQEPSNLKGFVKIAWVGLYNSIDQQVKGYKDKSRDPMQGGTQGGTQAPALQEKEKEKEKEEYYNTQFDIFWDRYNKKIDKSKCLKKFYKLDKQQVSKIIEVVGDYVNSTPEIKFRKNPLTWLNGECWNDEIEKENFKDYKDFLNHG